MAGTTPRSELDRIYGLIQAERLEEAATALRPVVAADPDNDDAWWLLANAVSDPTEARAALERALDANPDNQQARDLLAKLQSAYPELTPAVAQPALVATPNFDQPDFFPEPFQDLELNRAPDRAPAAPIPVAPQQAEPPSRWVPLALAAMFILVVVLFGYYLLVNRPTTTVVDATPSQVVVVVPTSGTTLIPGSSASAEATSAPSLTETLAPTSTAVSAASTQAGLPVAPSTSTTTTIVPATSAVSTTAATSVVIPSGTTSLDSVTAAFKAGGLNDALASIEDSILGKTLTVKLCSKSGPDLITNTDKARDLLAAQAAPFKGQVEAVGVRIANCADAGNVLYNRVTPLSVAQAFAESRIDARAYHVRWINP